MTTRDETVQGRRAGGARGVATVLALALATSGCGLLGGAESADDPAPTAEAPVERASDPTPVDASTLYQGLELDLEVGPLAVTDGLGVLRVQVTAAGEGGLPLAFVFGDTALGQADSFAGLRLVDTEAGVVRDAAYVDGVPLGAATDGAVVGGFDGEPLVGHVVFAAPDGATTAVLVPHVGLVEDVPVVDAADAADLTVPLDELTDASPDDVVAPVAFLETFTTQDDGAVRTRVAEEEVTVAVDSDVLFAVDSAELGAGADEALQAVGAELARAGAGDLRVVGHTDDVGEEAANQDLSERRAQAVADRLGQVADLGDLALVVEGKGETEPIDPGASDEARALNRRVEIRFVPAETAVTTSASDVEAAQTGGPTVQGAGTARVEYVDDIGTRPLDVELLGVRRVGAYLVGDLEVRNPGPDYVGFVGVLGSVRDGRGNLSDASLGAGNVTLLDGGTRVYPSDYLASGELDFGALELERLLLGDRSMGSLGTGQSTHATVVWPDTGQDVVTVDVPDGSLPGAAGSAPVRFVDVPVQG